jgi:hypothetical protein
MNDDIRQHCAQIAHCNQRGGRMLSVVDLLKAGTVTPDLAAYALAAIGGGASFLVGALPGGAGKTTVMGALLNFVPPDVPLLPADGGAAITAGRAAPAPRRCYICHEIGAGPYYAYLWGQDLRDYFDLPTAGHMLATNLHADTFPQARDQICRDNAVAAPALRRMNLMFFLEVARAAAGVGGARRRIVTAWESDGTAAHRQVYDADGRRRAAGAAESAGLAGSALVPPAAQAQARQTIDRLVVSGARTIEQVRAAVVAESERKL